MIPAFGLARPARGESLSDQLRLWDEPAGRRPANVGCRSSICRQWPWRRDRSGPRPAPEPGDPDWPATRCVGHWVARPHRARV